MFSSQFLPHHYQKHVIASEAKQSPVEIIPFIR